MPLINCKINLILTWSSDCFIISYAIDSQVPTFAINDAKLYVLIVNVSTQNYYNNYNLFLKEQLTGMNINQKQQYKHSKHSIHIQKQLQ